MFRVLILSVAREKHPLLDCNGQSVTHNLLLWFERSRVVLHFFFKVYFLVVKSIALFICVISLWPSHPMEYYPSIKRNELSSHARYG